MRVTIVLNMSLSVLVSVSLLFLLSCESRDKVFSNESFEQRPPNFLFIVADDMGYSDFTPFGGEISTPHLSGLAKEGVRISNFYTAPTCSPARSMFLTGVDNHLNGLGAMKEYITPMKSKYPEIATEEGYLGYLNTNVVTIAQLLKSKDYNTYISGKWHLGEEKASWPINKGFDESFVLLQGSSTHFGQPLAVSGAQYDATLVENDKEVQVTDDFYTSIGFTDKLIEFIDEDNEKPFFAYLAFTAVHDPLQVASDYSKKYKGVYDQGYDKLRQERYDSLVEQGFFSAKGSIGEKMAPKWEELSEDEKKRHARTMEIYAGMIDCIDEQVGKVIDQLKKTDRYDNTMIVFFSDNGSSNIYLEEYSKLSGRTESSEGPNYIEENFDQSYENIGNKDSAPAVGPGWAQASMSPFRLWKGTVAEGGIRTPTIIKWNGLDKKKIGVIDTMAVGHVFDFAPTIYDFLNIDYPSTYKNKDIVPLSGVSMLPFLKGTSRDIHKDYIAWELHGEKALRKGQWKILWVKDDSMNEHWELYNLSSDIGETKDVSEKHPEEFEELKKLYREYVRKNQVLDIR